MQQQTLEEVEVVKKLKLMANIGVERSPEKGSDNHPSFALAGISYDLSERITIDGGEGDDRVFSVGSNDVVEGGTGTDTIYLASSVAGATTGLTINLVTGEGLADILHDLGA